MSQGERSLGLSERLSEAIEALGRWFEGRFVVAPDPSDAVVAADDFLDPAVLRAAVARAGPAALGEAAASPDSGDVNLGVAVSRFTRHYAAAITAVALVGLANGVGIDVSASRCRRITRGAIPYGAAVDIDETRVLRCAARPTTWPAGGATLDTLEELRTYVWRTLYGDHIAPLFALVRETFRISESVMWNNAAEWAAIVSDAADEYLGVDAGRPYVEERVALLAAESLPGVTGANPLLGLMEWTPVDAPDFPHGVQVRRYCCMTYLLPDRLGRLCGNCGFLPLEDRIALTRERHGVPISASQDGPAVTRAIALGLQKVRTRP